MKGVIWFGKRGKLALRYIGPYEVLQRVENVSYKLALSPEMERIHLVFHVFMLRKYVLDPNKVVSEPDMEISKDLSYVNSLFRMWHLTKEAKEQGDTDGQRVMELS